jgi:hypothetical protein
MAFVLLTGFLLTVSQFRRRKQNIPLRIPARLHHRQYKNETQPGSLDVGLLMPPNLAKRNLTQEQGALS